MRKAEITLPKVKCGRADDGRVITYIVKKQRNEKWKKLYLHSHPIGGSIISDAKKFYFIFEICFLFSLIFNVHFMF